jgi:hypothetical protein
MTQTIKNVWKSIGTTGQIFLGVFVFYVVAKALGKR